MFAASALSCRRLSPEIVLCVFACVLLLSWMGCEEGHDQLTGDASVDGPRPDSAVSCISETCAELGFDCGEFASTCGNVLDCGECLFPKTCGGGGVEHMCGESYTVGQAWATDPPVFSERFEHETMGAIASNGSTQLVVWLTEKGGIERASNVVRATRLDATGAVVDPAGIALSGMTSRDDTSIYSPAVASDGEDFFVVWPYDGVGEWSLYGAQVSAETGEVSPPGGEVICLRSGSFAPAVASNGQSYLVVWHEYLGPEEGPGIYGIRVDAQTGTALDSTGLAISTGLGKLINAQVASNGSDYLVSYMRDDSAGGYEIHAVRVAADGSVQDSAPIVLAGASSNHTISVDSDGMDYLVAWEADGTIQVRRVDSNTGGTPDLAPISVDLAPTLGKGGQPRVHYVDGSYYIIWFKALSGRQLYIARVDAATGELLDPEPMRPGVQVSWSDQPGVVDLGDDFFIISADSAGTIDIPGSKNVMGCQVARADGHVTSAPAPVASTGNRQQTPAIASAPEGHLLVWIDQRNEATSALDVYGLRLGQEGEPAAAELIPIGTDQQVVLSPQVAYHDEAYLVVWEERADAGSSRVQGRLVDASSGALGEPFTLGGGGGKAAYIPALGATDHNFCVFWQQGEDVVQGARVTHEGLVATVSPLSASLQGSSPEVASNGDSCLVLWSEADSLWGQRFEAQTGSPLSAAPQELDHSVDPDKHSLTSNGTDYLAVWVRSDEKKQIFARAVEGASGKLAPIVRVSEGEALHYDPRAIWDGSAYVVLWETNMNYPVWQVLGRRLSLDQETPLLGAQFVVQENAYGPALTPLGGNQVLAAVSALVPDTGTQRIRWFPISYRLAPLAALAGH